MTPLSSPDTLQDFQVALTDWFREEGEDYPWRRTTDPYAILVSELMLQQTRIATVLGRGYYSRWMKSFPDWASLAEAREEDLLKAWEGLGYYNRARNLQRAAREVLESHGGEFPESLEEIESLPGVGRYTAGAVYSFALGRRAPIVDGNVVRVLSRLFRYREPVDTTKARREFWKLADEMTPGDRVRNYNSAIMELGQRVCVRSKPDCASCPVSPWCEARAEGDAERLPVKKGKTQITDRVERVALAVRNEEVFLEQETGGRRKGLWKLPEIAEDLSADLEEWSRFSYAITRYRIELRLFRIPDSWIERVVGTREGEWHSMLQPEALPPLGAPYRKAIERLLASREDLI